MSGLSVSFLVSAGAGVSLINVKVWDKFYVKVEATEYHNIVVDDHPINVHGSASVCITIANITYHKNFIIAVNNITDEGILRMDFMKANKCIMDIAKRQLILQQLEHLALVPSNL